MVGWQPVSRVWGELKRFVQDVFTGLRVLLERLKEEISPFPPEPWRRG